MTNVHYGLDFKAGAALFSSEKYGDWYRDPWGWPEITWASRRPDHIPLDELVEKTKDGICPKISPEFKPISVPKSLLGIRPAVIISPDARLLYLAAVGPNCERFHRDLPDWVYGWRQRNGGRLGNNSGEWTSYLRWGDFSNSDLWVLSTDITSFFASISAERLIQEVIDRLGSTACTSIIASIVRAHDGLSAHSGIPQRSWGSSVLANMYLRPLDDCIAQWLLRPEVACAARWMDDIEVVGSDKDLYSLNLELQDRARQAGLELNASKSRLIPVEQYAEEFELVGMRDVPTIHVILRPASGAEVTVSRPNLPWLLDKEEKILDAPSNYKHSVIRYVLRNLREYDEYNSYEKWLDLVPKLPHHAEHIGRYLRKAAQYPLCRLDFNELGEWFSDYIKTPWARLPWARAQMALIFDSTQSKSATMQNIYRDWLWVENDLQLLAVAVQRLGAVDPGAVRDIARGRLDHISSPLTLRVLGLGLMTVDEERAIVDSILQRDPRNILLCEMLRDQGYKAPKVQEDFDLTNGQ